MILKTKKYAKLCTIFCLVFILQPVLSEIQSGDELKQPKRTIGFLFRSFVNAFQTQRQPEPTVHSYQPLKQTQQPHTTSQSTLHSTKTDLLASSRNIFEQKKNLFKPSTARAPEVNLKQLIPTNPNRNHPAAQFQPQSEPCNFDSLQGPPLTPLHPTQTSQFETHNTLLNFHSPNVPLQPRPPHKVVSDPYRTSYERLPLNSLPANQQSPALNSIPSSNHHPHLPLKANIFILPFQEHHAAAPSLPEFNPQTSPPVAHPPINYQAELYLPPSAIPTIVNHYPTRFSASNGWPDVDDIISRGNQQPFANKEEKEYNKNTNTIAPEILPNNLAAAPEETTPKYPEQIPSSDNQNGNPEHFIGEYNRDTQHSFRSDKQDSAAPLFVPQVHQSISFSPESYKNENGGVDRSFQVDPTFTEGGFEHSVEQAYSYKTQNVKDTDIIQTEHQNPKNYKNVINDRNSKSISSSHGYESHQREEDVEFRENLVKTNYYDETFFGNTAGDSYNLNPYIEDNSFGIIQYPTRIGRLPDFLTEYY